MVTLLFFRTKEAGISRGPQSSMEEGVERQPQKLLLVLLLLLLPLRQPSSTRDSFPRFLEAETREESILLLSSKGSSIQQ